MGISGNDKALMYALGGLARGGATRGGYVSHLPFISIGGIWTGAGAARRVLVASLTVQDLLNETPNTCTFTVQGARPLEGSDVVMTQGSTSAAGRLFGGTILRVQEIVVGQAPLKPTNLLYQCEGIDYTWSLNAKLVSARYRSQSATAIALDLLARFAPPGYTSRIAAALPDVDEITFTNTAFMDCLTQLAGRIGGYAKCDYFRRIWLWTTLPEAITPPPGDLTADHPSLETVSYTRDLSPVVTRALVEGGGVAAIETCLPGETRIPVEDNAWFDPAGGYVVSGPQRIRYTGAIGSGTGALASAVGGATGNTAPSAAPSVGTVPGAGLAAGIYQYAYTWTTATGESLPSPPGVWNAGSVGGPTAAPTATPQEGAGLGTGTYGYAYTWTTPAGGETVPSPLGTADTRVTTIGAPGGLVPSVHAGAGLPNGTYRYAVTFTTGGGAGETTPSPMSAATTSSSTSTSSIPNPTAGPSNLHAQAGDGLGTGTYTYGYTFVDSHGETQASPGATVTTSTATISPPNLATGVTGTPQAGGITATQMYYICTFVTPTGETTAGGMSGPANSAVPAVFTVTGIQLGPAGVTARKIYRTSQNGQQPFRYVKTIADNTTRSVTDATPDAGMGATVPGSNTAVTYTRQVMVDGIATGPAGVTARKIYRSPVNGGAGALRYLATISNNSGTQVGVDTVPDGNLGASPPSSNTTGSSTTTYLQQVAITGVPVGPGGVTGRNIYRTAKGATQLQLLQTIANNTATTGTTDTAPDGALGANAPTTNTTTITANQVVVTDIAPGPLGVNARNLYRTAVGGAALQFVARLEDNATTGYVDAIPDAALGASAPVGGTAVLAQATLADIAVGASGTTGRNIYRTPKNGAGLQRLGTIANNTATTFPADATPDGALGVAAPTTDTSGLPSGGPGQVNAGSPTIPVSSPTPFAPEGWALVGGQLVRYRGVTSTTITGIPSTGIGSLGISIPYNTPIQVVSQLTGIPTTGAGAIVETILQGDPVNLLVIHDDLEAQGILKALLGGAADGVIEHYDQDRRISRIEAAARADAWLALKSRVLETIRYRCRDPRSQSGATVTVNLPVVEIAGTFQIQDVTIAGFLGVPTVQPTYDVVASSSRFTFEDLIRRLRGA